MKNSQTNMSASATIERIRDIMKKSIIIVYTSLMLLILFLCLFGDEMQYYLKKDFPYSNIIYLVLGAITIGLMACAAYNIKIQIHINDKQIMLGLNILLGLGLLFVTYHYYFKTGWDAGVIIEDARKLAYGELATLDHAYFSRCRNNVFLLQIFSWVIRLGTLLPIGNYYFYLVMLQCIIFAYGGMLIYCIGTACFSKRHQAVLAWILYVLMVGMSPWVVVPYTDSVALFFMVSLLYLYVRKKSPWLFGMLLVMGYYVKPQILILGIAIAIYHGPQIMGEWKQFRHRLISLALGALVGLAIVKGTVALSPIQIDNQRNFGVPHYIMLGLNERTNGVFAEEDWYFSESFETEKARTEGNIAEATKRLQNLGVFGLAEHIGRKLMTTYNDGSFAWGAEGGFFQEMLYSGNTAIRDFFRNIYIPEGRYFSHFLNLTQILWMGILLYATMAVLDKRKDEKSIIMALTIVGVTLFEVLLEPRARHIFIYLPVYILLACYGIEKTKVSICCVWSRNRQGRKLKERT